ncbi:MAG: hypothetical protein BROFUL_01350 [Candidatus Brocadia fulgida]|jgi:hypothetical protein|uniref:C2H2-type domain-containing protein n=1 Tax=Candidatus Brocadia fulgida TaxID=380242 RepID=A0A0M2UV74_9BACT|nr:MAG: hypothetical protein BROFUL_01350 [Candidatus Brocadia fulgida]
MKRYFKDDCSHCNEYPHECDVCSSEIKASIHFKSRHRSNKKRDFKKDDKIVYNN